MKLPEEQKTEIVDGLLQLLDPEATKIKEEIKEVEGRNLIYQGVTKDTKGRQILPGLKYLYSTKEVVKVNHAQEIGHIIADADTQEQMTDKLGEYLAKYAKDREGVRRSIPAHVLAASIKKSDN